MRLQSIRRGVRDAEGVVPYRAVGKFSWLLSHVVIVACSFDGRTMFAPTDVCGIIKGCEINNNAKCQRGVGGADFVLQYGVCLIYGSRVLFTL